MITRGKGPRERSFPQVLPRGLHRTPSKAAGPSFREAWELRSYLPINSRMPAAKASSARTISLPEKESPSNPISPSRIK